MEDASASKYIPHQIGGLQNDSFRFGLDGVKSDIVGSHPLQSSLQSVISLNPIYLSSLQLLLLIFLRFPQFHFRTASSNSTCYLFPLFN